MDVYQKDRYSNEAERANLDIYDDFKLKITLWSLGLYTNISAPQGLGCPDVESELLRRLVSYYHTL